MSIQVIVQRRSCKREPVPAEGKEAVLAILYFVLADSA